MRDDKLPRTRDANASEVKPGTTRGFINSGRRPPRTFSLSQAEVFDYILQHNENAAVSFKDRNTVYWADTNEGKKTPKTPE